MAASLAHKLGEIYRTEDIEIEENVCFSGLLLPEKILQGLTSAGFVRPSPIQLKAIPLGRCGLDLIIQAKSGTGKTCVFTVVALESLLPESLAVQVLILTPTREIAVQVAHVIGLLGNAFPKLKCYAFIGGMKLSDDKTKLQNCQIVVGTPGRIKQLIGKGMLRTESIRLFVLDEADKLLERNFQEDMNWIYSSLPTNKQMIAASATYPRELAQFLTKYMRNPTFVCLNSDDPALRGVKQYYKTVAFHPVSHVLFNNKVGSVIQILNSISFSQCLIFTNYQIKAEALCSHLGSIGWPAIYISGCMDQQQRLKALASLQQFQCRILVSTDLSSRGIDAEHVNLVINFDVPWDLETYFHRIGRAGRFGTVGIAISLTSGESEDEMFQKIKSEGSLNIFSLPETIDDTIWVLDKQRNAVSEIHSKEEIASDEKVKSPNATVVKGNHIAVAVEATNAFKMKEQQSSFIYEDLSPVDNDSEVSQYFEEGEKKVSAFNIKNNMSCSDGNDSTELLNLSDGFVNGNYKPELQESPTGNIKENLSTPFSSSNSQASMENCEFISNSNDQEMLNNKIPVTSFISDTRTEIISTEFSEINNEIIISSTESEMRIESCSVDNMDTCQISTNTFADTIKEFLPAMQQVQGLKLPKEVFRSVNEVIYELLETERAKVQTQSFELMHYKDVIAKLNALKVADEVAVQSNLDSSSSGFNLNILESDSQPDEDENCNPVISTIKNCDETKLSHNMLEEVTKNLLDSYESMNTQLNAVSVKLMQIAEEKQKNILAKFEIDSASSENESINSEYEKELDLLILSEDVPKVNYIDQNSPKIENPPIKTATVTGSENESAELTLNNGFSNTLRINSDIITEHNYSKPNYYYNGNTQNLERELNKKVAASLDSNVHNSEHLKYKPKSVEIPNCSVETAGKNSNLSSSDLIDILYVDSIQSLGQCDDKAVPSERFDCGKDKLVFSENLCNTVNQDKQGTRFKTMMGNSSKVNISAESKKMPAAVKNKDAKLNENSVYATCIESEKTRSLPLSPIIQLANKKIPEANLELQSQFSTTNESSAPEDEDSDSEYSDRSDYSSKKHQYTSTFNSDYLTTLESQPTQNGKLKQKATACANNSPKDVSLSSKGYSLPLVDTEASVANRKPTGSPRTNSLREQSAKLKTPQYDTGAAGDTLDNSGFNATKESQMQYFSNEAVVNAWHSYWQQWQEVVQASSASNQDDRDDTSAATTSSHENRRSAHSHRKDSTHRARNKSRLPKNVSEDYECQRNSYEKYYEKYIDQWKRYWEDVNKYFTSYHSNRSCRHKHAGKKKRRHSHRPCCHSETQPFPYMHNTTFPYGVSGPYQYPCSCMYSWLHYKQYLDYVTSMYRY